jgi:hypothetical protein
MAHPTDEHHQAGRRYCYYVPPEGYVEGYGYRVSLIFEGVRGHFPIGVHPWEPGADQLPLFWGHDYAAAAAEAERQNRNLDEETKRREREIKNGARGADAQDELERVRVARNVERMTDFALRK